MKTPLNLTVCILSTLLWGACVQSPKPEYNDARSAMDAANFSNKTGLLEKSEPENVGINSADLVEIDKIVSEAIKKKAAPSVNVMIIKDAKVIFHKAFGTHSYIDYSPTKATDIYDLASITKIAATTLAAMRLYEQGNLNLDATMGFYLPDSRSTNKSSLRVRDLMVHEAGLVPQIPFHLALKPADYSSDSTSSFPTKVSEDFFLRKGYYEDVMWPKMLKSEITKAGKYLYSDLSMYFIKEIIEKQSGMPLEKYVQEEFYKPLSMTRTGFNPLRRYTQDQIVPTEKDEKFRKNLIKGYVHDEGAALAGGVSGHAGLFGSAGDLGILFQMLLNRGSYNGRQYFKPETVDMFTAQQSSKSRRGLGFDRWDPKSEKGFPSKLASPQTYGHTGFTGTCVWVDPKYNLIYIFLSNRVNPNRSDKLIKLNIRGRIQDVIYKAILKEKS